MTIGVYQIRNIENNKFYIGSTSLSFEKRKTVHFSNLKRGNHHSKKLQNAYNKYGDKSFVFEILEECVPEDCIKNEQKWIDLLKPHKNGYNILPNAGSCRGYTCSQSHKQKISASEKGKKISLETRKKLSIAHMGQNLGIKKGPMSQEIKDKIGAANRGTIMSQETKKKISDSLVGRKRSLSVIMKLRMIRGKKVGRFDKKTGEKLEEFISTAEVQRKYGYLNQGVSRACAQKGSYKGFYWKYL